MERIHEKMKHEILLAPVSQNAGANTTGAFKSAAQVVFDMLLIVTFAALAAGKKVTAEVIQADDAVPNGSAEITACETVYTAPAGGVTSGKILISLDKSQLSKPYISVKVTNDADAPVVISAEMIYEAQYRAGDLNTATVV